MDRLGMRLQKIIAACWRVPTPEGPALLHVLLHSPLSRVREFRQALLRIPMHTTAVSALQETRELEALFTTVLTPAFVLQMMEDVQAVRALTLPEVRCIEECMLQQVSASGTWKGL